MYCKKCGQEIPDNVSFCGKCGAKVENVLPEKPAMGQTAAESKQHKRKSGKRKWKIILPVLLVLLIVLALPAAIILKYDSGIGRLRSEVVPMNEAEVGNTVIFGSYEQDNDSGNGAEPIEWIVLDKRDDMLLLISGKVLDRSNYYGADYPVTWKESYLRFWLNSVFYETAFTEEEQQMILQTEVVGEDNSKYETNGGRDTDDHIFLLSISSVKKYLPFRWNRKAEETIYAAEKDTGYRFEDESEYAHWWLRSPGMETDYAADVNDKGAVVTSGFRVDTDNIGVRPSLWVRVD